MSYTSLKEFRNLPFKIPTFYLGSVVIISHQITGKMRSMEKGWAQFCLIDYVWIYWTLGGDLILARQRHNSTYQQQAKECDSRGYLVIVQRLG